MNPAAHAHPKQLDPSDSAVPSIRIKDKVVGPGRPVYVVAEAGVSHNGDVSMARELIDVACEAGADAIKFQLFSAKRLVSASARTCAYQRRTIPGTANQREMLSKLELEASAFTELKHHADQRRVHFLATPFGIPELKRLVDMGAPALKLASTDLVNVPLLAAAAGTRLPIILSTGASLLDEIDEAVALLSGDDAPARLALLHCVSTYPTPPTSARLGAIRALADRYKVPVGFSDHTEDTTFSGLAVAAGACVLEKHITLRRSLPGPDHFFSLEPNDFVRYVKAARFACTIMGDGRIGLAPSEREVRELGRGSIVTAVPIRRGTRLTKHDLLVQRPGGGIDPRNWNDIIGRVAATDIPADTRMGWDLLE